MKEETSPQQTYTQRQERWRDRLAHLGNRDDLAANLRLLVFLVGAGLLWATLAAETRPLLWNLLPAAAFLALVIYHARLRKAQQDARVLDAWYEQALARLRGEWPGKGVAGESLLPAEHPYARALSILGRGSLFEYLCMARTQMGQRRLADWLLGPAPPETVLQRQEAVQELAPQLELRERLIVQAQEEASRIAPEHLTRWVRAPDDLPLRTIRRVNLLFLVLLIASLPLSLWLQTPALALLLALSVAAWFACFRKRLHAVVHQAEAPIRELRLAGGVIETIEESAFSTGLLQKLHKTIMQEGKRASKQIDALDRLFFTCESLSHNTGYVILLVFLWIAGGALAFGLGLGALLLARIQLPATLERRRVDLAENILGWLDTVGEFEALSSLANYCFEHPDDTFPELLEGAALFDGRRLGHPLLTGKGCIHNDVLLGGGGRQLFIISGSNMSGKTTLLRTVGVNAVLALAGAPVRAEKLRLSPLNVGAVINAQDSIQAGVSQFYEEILEIKRTLDLTRGPYPVLFLFDELLHGTNSHDRRAGSLSLLRHLLAHNAIGLITTHDLALTDMVETLDAQAENIHFTSTFSGGKLHFDYRIHPGVVAERNAIPLMQSIGLPVSDA